MNKKLIRRFHPIGQGAFYSEKHDNFNMVYDCGSTRTKNAQPVVKTSFSTNAVIDCLFISHFDLDHVSLIPTLQNNFKIKLVVLPLLHDVEKFIITQIYKALGVDSELIGLLNNPNEFFGDDTIIIQVKPYNTEIERRPAIPFPNTSQTIESGTSLTKGDFWEYIPYNIEHKRRSDELRDLLVAEGFNLIDFESKTFVYSEKDKKPLSKIYNQVTGKINNNSMMVYSGPIDATIVIVKYFYNSIHYPHYSIHYPHNKHGIGCIFTGDVNLNLIDLTKFYSKEWNNVKTIQVPHHGDIKCFDVNILNDNYYNCPISFGKNNNYGHPAGSVTSNIISLGSFPYFITEDMNSLYIQDFLYRI